MHNANILLAAVALANVILLEQSLTIPEAVERSRPSPYIISRTSELSIAPLDEVIKAAELVAVGTIKEPRAYLSEDKKTLFTDWTLVPERLISASNLPSSPTAGPAPIIIRTWGGETTISGVKVNIFDQNFRPLAAGSRYLVFLAYNHELGMYEICDQGAYAIEVDQAGRLRPLVKRDGVIDPAVEGTLLEEAIKDIQRRRF